MRNPKLSFFVDGESRNRTLNGPLQRLRMRGASFKLGEEESQHRLSAMGWEGDKFVLHIRYDPPTRGMGVVE